MNISRDVPIDGLGITKTFSLRDCFRQTAKKIDAEVYEFKREIKAQPELIAGLKAAYDKKRCQVDPAYKERKRRSAQEYALRRRKNNPEFQEARRVYRRKQRSLCAHGEMARDMGLPVSACTPELLEIKRLTILLGRRLRENNRGCAGSPREGACAG